MTKKSKSESTPSKQTVLFQSTDAIEISLFIEKKALGFYEKAANNVSDPRVKDMFTRLAEEEREHIQTLQTKVRFLQPAISGKEKRAGTSNYLSAMSSREKLSQYLKQKWCKNLKVLWMLSNLESSQKNALIETLSSLLENKKKLDVKAIFSHLMVVGKSI
jgi:rubrerythrin